MSVQQNVIKDSCFNNQYQRINRPSCLKITVAIGTITALGGIFVIFASYQILPHGINAISQIGLWGQIVGFGMMSSGLMMAVISGIKIVQVFKKQEFERKEQIQKDLIAAEEKHAAALTCRRTIRMWLVKRKLERLKIEKEAATALQKYSRTFLIWSSYVQEMESRNEAALKIQNRIRSQLAYDQIDQMTREAWNRAALKIQTGIRSHLAHHHLEQIEKEDLPDSSLIEAAKQYTTDRSKLAGVPHPSIGQSKYDIYMPRELPLVLRDGDKDKNLKRFSTMKQVRRICSQHKSRCVTVPKAVFQNDFIVEERLPNDYATMIQGMVFYFENRQQFTEAIQELTSILCYGRLSDIVGGNRYILNRLGQAQMPRFDNLLLYTTQFNAEKLFCIGMIDVETFQLNSLPLSSYQINYGLSTAVQLFPYHLDVIIAVGQSFYALPDWKIKELEKEAEESLQLYRIVCENPISFYQRHQITFENQALAPITPERQSELIESMGLFIAQIDKGGKGGYVGIQDCLNSDSEQAIQVFKDQIVPGMISLMKECLEGCYISKKIANYGQMIENRLITHNFTSGLSASFLRITSKETLQQVFRSNDTLPLMHVLFEELLNKMVEGGELSYYKPYVYSTDDVILF